VTFAPPTGGTFTNIPTPPTTLTRPTDAQGNWTASVTTTNPNDRGTWTVSSSYAGASGYLPSQATPCQFPVQSPPPT